MTQMGELGLTEGFVTAFPNGTGSPVRWSVGDGADSPEPAFVDAVLDESARPAASTRPASTPWGSPTAP